MIVVVSVIVIVNGKVGKKRKGEVGEEKGRLKEEKEVHCLIIIILRWRFVLFLFRCLFFVEFT